MNRHPPPLAQRPGAAWRRQLHIAQGQAGAWWAKHTPRERRLLRAGTVFIAVALLWTIGLKPALDSIALSNERLPHLRADAARVDALILESQALQRRQSGRIDASGLPQALQASLRRAGLETAAQVNDAPDATGPASPAWEISITDASAARVMEWLAGLPQLLHVQITAVDLARSRIDGRDRPGQVSGLVIVRLPKERAP